MGIAQQTASSARYVQITLEGESIMASKKSKSRKEVLADELESHFANYTKLFVVGVDNVTSNQLHEIRKSMRGEAVIYCGKNTQMRRVLRKLEEQGMEQLEKIRQICKLNIALVFTNGDLATVCENIVSNKMPAAAKAGALAQRDVIIPAGPTSLEPTMTSFLQALNISSKISKGNIEILNETHLLVKGEKVDASSAALLAKLDIMPFAYGLEVKYVYDNGSLFEPAVLAISKDDIVNRFKNGAKNVAAVSIELGKPCVASVPYSLLLAFQNLLAVACATDFTFAEAADIKKYLKDPSSFSFAAAPAAGGGAAPKAAAKKKSTTEDDDAGAPGGGLFDDAGDDY